MYTYTFNKYSLDIYYDRCVLHLLLYYILNMFNQIMTSH